MNSLLLGSFPNKASLVAPGGSCERSKIWTNNCLTSSYAPTTASWPKRKIKKEYNFLRFKQSSLVFRCEGIEGGPTCQECNRKHIVKATSGQSFESEPPAFDSKRILTSVKNSLDAFYRFSRPHTVIGTALSIVSVSLLAVQKSSDISPLFFTGVLEINKPYLPLASGEYSVGTGVTIVASFSFLSFWLGWIVGSWPLFWALFISFVLGTAYSIDVPLLRWKRFAVLAAMCILAVRAVIVQLAFFLHMQTHVYKRPVVFSRPLIFATAFMSFFSVVIALFKDIPDIEGDRIFGIQSFSVRLGQQRVFWICVSLLEVAYGVALMVGAASPCLWSKIITGTGHAAMALILWFRAKSVDFKNKASITSFYMFIWKLFYAEYLLIPLVR
ncbi:homogentisate phytyltransferase 1, chloroplastic isoform X9 [Arachis hypogaea]|uniref:homogentisate phytyltransferase 1, chloroplastic isoform X9 n=1 Tax=Arachis hypogaea TaxID=3818 RepID=UPI003B222312